VTVKPQYLEYILEQMGGLGAVSTRRMFGAVGLYSGELFFGLIDFDTLFLKTDETNSAQYMTRNMPRFMTTVNRPMGYYQVPADIIEESEALVSWARQSVGVALRSQAVKSQGKAARPPARRKARR
jgi:DNA transformation protein and related proteins